MLTDSEKRRRNNLGYSWFRKLGSFMVSDEMKKVAKAVNARRKADKVNVLPEREDMFRAFRLTPFEDVKVVILGPEPFNNPHFVDGLAYSCPDIFERPEVCGNIHKAVIADLHSGTKETEFMDSNLQRWAEQGVLLLNECLTVEEGTEFSHAKLGWGALTHEVLKLLLEDEEPKVFMAWGINAQTIIKSLEPEESNHAILSAPNPAEDSFLATNCFTTANTFLLENQLCEINW